MKLIETIFTVTLYNTAALICINSSLTNAQIIMSQCITREELNH